MLLKVIAIVALFECALIGRSQSENCSSSLKKVYVPEYNFKTNWYNASLTCVSQGLRLASIESPEDQANIATMIVTQGLSSELFFVAGTDLAYNGRWVWFSTAKVLSYTNWNAGQPATTANYDCMYLSASTQKWAITSCASVLYFICEGELKTAYD